MALQFRQHRFNPIPWFITSIFGVLLVAMATPALISLYISYPATRLVSDLSDASRDISIEEVSSALKQFEIANGYEQGRRRSYSDQATLLLNLYYKLKSTRRDDEANRFLEQASQAIDASLRLAPGNANLWYLLAEIRALQGKMDHKTRRILSMSYLSGPREGWIALRRLQFSLRYWLLLDKGLRRHVKKEIRTLWSTPSYRRTFTRQFSSSSVRAQGVIFSQIKTYGSEEVRKFLKYAKRAGWNAAVLKPAY